MAGLNCGMPSPLAWPLLRKGLDVVVAIRGGGSQADLAAFDSERVARALATTPVPVWVGVGHTGDRTVADELAHRYFATPTALPPRSSRLTTATWRARSKSMGRSCGAHKSPSPCTPRYQRCLSAGSGAWDGAR